MAAARRRRPLRAATVARIAFVGFWMLFLLVPLYWMFITSIKPSNDYLAVPPVWFPDEPTLVHYSAALYAYRGLDGLINSLIISTAAMRQDGTTQLYVDPSYPAAAHYAVTAALVEAAERLGVRYHVGVACSTGSWYCGQGRPGFGGYGGCRTSARDTVRAGGRRGGRSRRLFAGRDTRHHNV